MSLVKEAKTSVKPSPIEYVMRPINHFLEYEASSGIVLCITTLLALLWANSPFSESYFSLWQTPVMFGFGEAILEKPLIKWINDGLMALFFFVVGLEMKREVLVGELSKFHQAILPVSAAIGGMVVPAGLYLFFNVGQTGEAGWGIPMATDIAFALGVLALLGDRVPQSLKIFLIGFAIVDDLGAILIIALFYSDHIAITPLVWATLGFLCLMGVNALGIRHPIVYSVLGVGGVWLALLLSGVHATMAGILVALTIPARPAIRQQEFIENTEKFLDVFKRKVSTTSSILTQDTQSEAARAVKVSAELAQTPLQRLETVLWPWVSFGIMPLFALANAGIPITGDMLQQLSGAIPLGIFIGLLVGKQIGITLFTWMAVKFGLGELPEGITWRHVYAVGWLGAIGFTMSLFITTLAFNGSGLVMSAKSAILLVSFVAGVGGWLLLRFSTMEQSIVHS